MKSRGVGFQREPKLQLDPQRSSSHHIWTEEILPVHLRTEVHSRQWLVISDENELLSIDVLVEFFQSKYDNNNNNNNNNNIFYL